MDLWAPLPWDNEDNAGRGTWVGNPVTKQWVALACVDTDEQAIAHSNLIRASREIYEALDAIVTPEGWDVDENKWVSAVNALARARGEAS